MSTRSNSIYGGPIQQINSHSSTSTRGSAYSGNRSDPKREKRRHRCSFIKGVLLFYCVIFHIVTLAVPLVEDFWAPRGSDIPVRQSIALFKWCKWTSEQKKTCTSPRDLLTLPGEHGKLIVVQMFSIIGFIFCVISCVFAFWNGWKNNKHKMILWILIFITAVFTLIAWIVEFALVYAKHGTVQTLIMPNAVSNNLDFTYNSELRMLDGAELSGSGGILVLVWLVEFLLLISSFYIDRRHQEKQKDVVYWVPTREQADNWEDTESDIVFVDYGQSPLTRHAKDTPDGIIYVDDEKEARKNKYRVSTRDLDDDKESDSDMIYVSDEAHKRKSSAYSRSASGYDGGENYIVDIFAPRQEVKNTSTVVDIYNSLDDNYTTSSSSTVYVQHRH